MRKLLAVTVLLFAAGPAPLPATGGTSAPVQTAAVSEFSDGWQAGWAEGWKYVKGQYSIPPIAPIAPIPQAGRNGYRDGYNRGFVAGQAKAGGR
jgi:hypothetical protein